MDDLAQKLQSLLSDPESMRNLAELAAMLREPEPAADAPQPTSAEPPDIAPAAAQEAQMDDAPQLDLMKLLAVGQALSSVQHDETADLILALKPHLSATRAQRAEQAVRLLRLYAVAGVLRENGLLNDLLGAI